MIKAAIITERIDIYAGGAERSVFQLAAKLTHLNIDVTILAASGKTQNPRIKILCPEQSKKRTPPAIFERALGDYLAENRFDIVHSTLPFAFADVYQPRGGTYTEAVIRNAESYGNKMTARFKLMTHPANFHRAALLKAEKKLALVYDHTIFAALSEYVKQQFKQHYGLGDDRIVVIPNGVKTNSTVHTQQAHKLRSMILSELGITEARQPAIFLFAAYNFRLKGLASLITALSKLALNQTARPVYLVAAGSRDKKKYLKFAEKLGVAERIIFPGPLKFIQDALAISDAAVLPTYYDPCSRFILEALAQAKPVITTEFNGASEMFEHNRHGLVIDSPDNIDALAGAMAFYADPANAAAASEAIIQDRLCEKISIDTHAKKVVQLYNSILQKRGVRQ